jgi:hypothetical protein
MHNVSLQAHPVQPVLHFFVEIQVVEWKVVERHIVENQKTNIL